MIISPGTEIQEKSSTENHNVDMTGHKSLQLACSPQDKNTSYVYRVINTELDIWMNNF